MSYGLQAASYANNLLVASPPLPMLFMKSGASRYSVQPGYVEGKIDATRDSGAGSNAMRTSGKFYGGGGTIAFNRAFTDSFGFYIMAFGNNIGGDFSTEQATGCPAGCPKTEAKDIKAALGAASVGMNWTMLGGSPSNIFSAGLFVGPAITTASMTQRVMRTDSSGAVTDDFEMKVNPTFATALFGLQLGIRVGDWLLINPYIMSN